MTIFKNNLKRIFKNKSNFFFMIIFPIILIVFIIGFNNGNSKFTLGIVDNDKSKLTKLLINKLSTENKVNTINKSDIEQSLINQKNDYVIVIPRNFAKDCMQGKDIKIKGYRINTVNSSISVKLSIESFISAAKTIGNAAKNNETLFYNGMNKYNNGIFNIKYQSMDKSKVSKKNISFSLGFLVFNMLLLGTNLTPIILEDKKTKIYYRIFGGPVSAKNYTLQNILSFLVVLLLQVTIIFTFMINVFNVQFPSLLNMFLLFAIISVFVISFALFISNTSKDMRTSSAMSTLIVTPMAMLGGCFWPVDIMPPFLQSISKFIPTSWMLSAANKLLYGNNLYSILPQISVLILCTIAFMLLASWRKKDIIN